MPHDPHDDPADGADEAEDASGGVPWDGSTWVDVGHDDQWKPTFEERARALVVLLIIGGVLFLSAAIASLGDGDREPVAAATSTTGSTAPTTTTTTEPDSASLDGEPPPSGCEQDDRAGNPMRPRDRSTVLVLNGTSRTGHAGANTESLEDLGYSTMAPSDETGRDVTTVEYLEGFCAEADRLVTDLGISSATFAALDESADDDVFLGRAVLVVTLGQDSL